MFIIICKREHNNYPIPTVVFGFSLKKMLRVMYYSEAFTTKIQICEPG